VRLGEKRTRIAAKTSDEKRAMEAARALAEELARQQLVGVTPKTLTLGQRFDAYHEHKGRYLAGQWARGAAKRRQLFLTPWGTDTLVASICQTHVDRFNAIRRNSFLAEQNARWERRVADIEEKDRPPMPALRPLRDGALHSDFRWLSSALNWATGHRLPNGDCYSARIRCVTASGRVRRKSGSSAREHHASDSTPR
jgi:hypothetical protein